jgi:hypothetical protein
MKHLKERWGIGGSIEKDMYYMIAEGNLGQITYT